MLLVMSVCCSCVLEPCTGLLPKNHPVLCHPCIVFSIVRTGVLVWGSSSLPGCQHTTYTHTNQCGRCVECGYETRGQCTRRTRTMYEKDEDNVREG
ncbi:hypothetical protein Pmani_027013 [Petrolisthes manimaculis]|uniref:Secreted protein n=1 Tax=Petrolisthes manimaculis TaxID=1843537 RepID=A0AAE1P439_9EUCA|nr:hypothetical protein Pmani_027013 [Petrolisthes manimaculis]